MDRSRKTEKIIRFNLKQNIAPKAMLLGFLFIKVVEKFDK